MLLEACGECVLLLDASWNIRHANPEAQVRLGRSLEELLDQPFDSLFTAPLRRREIRSGRKVMQRAVHESRAGGARVFALTIQAFPNDCLLVTMRDISEQIENERLPRQQRDYYKALFENSPCAAVTFDAHFAIVEVNQALRKMLGYAGRQLYQRSVSDIFSADSQKEITGWRTEAQQKMSFSREMEITLRKRDGRPLNAQVMVTVTDEQQEAGAYGIITVKAVSACREAERTIALQHEINERLMSKSAAMIGMLDREGRIITVNTAVERVSGYRSSELIGKSIWECGLVDVEEMPMTRRRIQQILSGEETVTGVSRTRTKSGEQRILQVCYSTTRDVHGQVENIIITALDMTEQHRLQQLMMEAVEQEQARIGYTLHNSLGPMLTGIGSMTEVLLGGLQDRRKEDAARILYLIRQAVHQVRQLARSMSPAAVHDRDLPASLLLLADTVRTSFKIQCEVEMDPQVRVPDNIVSGHLFRLAQESVSNAIRHGQPRLLRITLLLDGPTHGVLEVFNDGETFDCSPGNATESTGIRVMKHRASLIHADFFITCPPDGGVRVLCRFPLPPVGEQSPRTKTRNQDNHRETQNLHPRRSSCRH